MSSRRVLRRRKVLQLASLGIGGWCCTSWLSGLVQAAEQSDMRDCAVILLWLNGGPATIDLWDLKPNHENGGPFKEISTAVPGLRISENLPRLAACAADFSIIRSMATREGDHTRARVVSLTGYTPQGAIQFPAIGSLVAHEMPDAQLQLPAYVHIGGRPAITSGGFLGPKYAPFAVASEGRGRNANDSSLLQVDNLTPPNSVPRHTHDSRLALLSKLQGMSQLPIDSSVIQSIESAQQGALQMMSPDAARAFDLNEESQDSREAYGLGQFGQGCLMARRLVERGVRFVEVVLDGWDTHANNFERVKELSTTLDIGFATLLSDLKQRGLLDSTLVICQGEFGRTPRINGQAGRDHWPSSWSLALGGAGIKGGQAIGQTSNDGTTIESKPTKTPDLMATIFRSVGLDPMKQNMSNVSRPIRLADPEAEPIEELLS